MRRHIRRRWFAAIPLTLVLIASLVALRPDGTQIVAYFPSAPGLYKGDPVKVMGVVVGSVQSVQPDGDRVRLTLEIGSQPVPADVRAAIVAPSLVSERFVQLAPAYTGGPKMASGAAIPVSRTAIPVSFDDVKRELAELATALGPRVGEDRGAGPLNRVIRTLDANLSPDAATQFRDSLTAMRGATESLAAGGDDLFSTLRNLNTFVENLSVNDRAARQLTVGLAGFAGVLDQNKRQLGSAIAGLDQVLKIVRQFVKENGRSLDTTVLNLKQVARGVASRSTALAGFLHAVPTAVDDLYNMMENNAVTARLSANNLRDLSQLLCGSVLGIGGTVAQCKAAVAPLLNLLGEHSSLGASGLPTTSSPKAPGPFMPPTAAPMSGIPLLDGLLANLTGEAQ